MNPTLFRATLRRWLSSPIRLVILGGIAIPPLISLGFTPDPSLKRSIDAGLFAVVLGTGVIGQDVSTGVLALVFVRPIRRSTYVLTKWLAVASSAGAVGLVQFAIAVAICAVRGAPPAASEFATGAGECLLCAFGFAAVFVFLSSIGPGMTDLALWAVSSVLVGVLAEIPQISRVPAAGRIARELRNLLTPQIDLAHALGARPPSWFAIASYLSTVTLCLALAIVLVNRKEVSYSSD